MKKLLLATSLLAASSAALAAGPQYTWVQGQWQESEIDGSRSELDGFGVSGSVELNNEFYAFGQYASLDDEYADADRTALGAAYKMPLSATMDLNLGAGLVSYDFGDEDDEGVLLTAGIRSMLDNNLEVGASATYEDVLDIDMLFSVYGAWHFNKQLSAGLALTAGEIDTTAIYVRVAF